MAGGDFVFLKTPKQLSYAAELEPKLPVALPRR
jgi:hypothetical protein